MDKKVKWQPEQLTTGDEQLLEQFSADDEQLLEQFFQTARQEEMADDGFSRRVMQRIETEAALSMAVERASRTVRLSWLWTAFCIVAAVGVFTWIGGWQHLLLAVLDFISTKPTLGMLAQLIFCCGLLTTLGAVEVLRQEHITLRSLRTRNHRPWW